MHIDGPQPQSVTPISPAPAVSPALQKAKSAVAALSQADLLALQKSLPPATYAAVVGQPAGMELDDTRLSADEADAMASALFASEEEAKLQDAMREDEVLRAALQRSLFEEMQVRLREFKMHMEAQRPVSFSPGVWVPPMPTALPSCLQPVAVPPIIPSITPPITQPTHVVTHKYTQVGKPPTFAGKIKPKLWLNKIVQFFQSAHVPPSDYLLHALPLLELDTPADHWYRSIQNKYTNMTWDLFVVLITQHFTRDQRDPQQACRDDLHSWQNHAE